MHVRHRFSSTYQDFVSPIWSMISTRISDELQQLGYIISVIFTGLASLFIGNRFTVIFYQACRYDASLCQEIRFNDSNDQERVEYKKQDWTPVTDAKDVSGLDSESVSPNLWVESSIYLSSRIWKTKYFD